MRTGLIGQKVGMTRVFKDDGEHVPVTVLKVGGCQVIGQRTAEKDGYAALRLAIGSVKAKNVSRPVKGQYQKAKVEAKRKIAEFRVSDEGMVDVGKELGPNHFVEGQFVDVVGTSIGKGFAGAMKRHNFAGLRASHGVSVSHRAHGSTGQCQDPGKVFKGKKMAGHLGDEQVTVQNLKVVETRPEDGLILISGAVPGSKGSWVLIQDAVKKPLPESAPMPAGLKGEAKPEAEKEEEKAEDPAIAKAEEEAKAALAAEKAEAAEGGAPAADKAEAKADDKGEAKPEDKPAKEAKDDKAKE